MATYTAQILVGHSHLYHGGIIPSHVFYLSENGRSAWCLYPLLESFNKDCKSSSHKVWICDPFTFIEDAMLVSGLFVRKDKELLKLAQHSNKEILTAQHVEITEVLSEKQRETLYERSKSISWYPLKKICVSVFVGSSIKNISKLEEYKDLEFEVGASFYRRSYNPFSDDFKTTDDTKSSDFPLYLERLKSGNFRR